MKVLRLEMKQLHRLKICTRNCFICRANREKKAALKAARLKRKLEKSCP